MEGCSFSLLMGVGLSRFSSSLSTTAIIIICYPSCTTVLHANISALIPESSMVINSQAYIKLLAYVSLTEFYKPNVRLH